MKRFKVLNYKLFRNSEKTAIKSQKFQKLLTFSLFCGHFEALFEHETANIFLKRLPYFAFVCRSEFPSY